MFVDTLEGVEMHEHVNGSRRGISAQRSGARQNVSLVIPTLGESVNPQCLLPTIGDIVDELVIVRERRAGKGFALETGFAACGGDIIVKMDADWPTAPAEIDTFVSAPAAGLRIVEAASYDEHRINRESNLSAVKDGYGVLSTIERARRRVRRYRANPGLHRPDLHSYAPMPPPAIALRDQRVAAVARVPTGGHGTSRAAVAVASVVAQEDALDGHGS